MDYVEEILKRDVADHALFRWRLPHKFFSRIMWTQEDIPGWQRPSDVCPDCLQAVIDGRIDRATLCRVPPRELGVGIMSTKAAKRAARKRRKEGAGPGAGGDPRGAQAGPRPGRI